MLTDQPLFGIRRTVFLGFFFSWPRCNFESQNAMCCATGNILVFFFFSPICGCVVQLMQNHILCAICTIFCKICIRYRLIYLFCINHMNHSILLSSTFIYILVYSSQCNCKKRYNKEVSKKK